MYCAGGIILIIRDVFISVLPRLEGSFLCFCVGYLALIVPIDRTPSREAFHFHTVLSPVRRLSASMLPQNPFTTPYILIANLQQTVSTLYKVKGKLGYGSLAGGGSDNKGAHSTAPNGNGNYVSFSPAARAATSGGKRREGGLSRPPSGRWDSESMSLLWRTSSGGNDNPNQTHPHHHPNRRSTSKKMYKRYSSRAFVTFRSFAAATVARQVLHCARPGRMAASSAPEPRDVYWPNAIVTRRQACAHIVTEYKCLVHV